MTTHFASGDGKCAGRRAFESGSRHSGLWTNRSAGPYRQWVHEHVFETVDGGTPVLDVVRYAVPFDALLHRWLLAPDIARIFEFRTGALQARSAER